MDFLTATEHLDIDLSQIDSKGTDQTQKSKIQKARNKSHSIPERSQPEENLSFRISNPKPMSTELPSHPADQLQRVFSESSPAAQKRALAQ